MNIKEFEKKIAEVFLVLEIMFLCGIDVLIPLVIVGTLFITISSIRKSLVTEKKIKSKAKTFKKNF